MNKDHERQYKDKELIKKLVPYVRPVFKKFILALILTVIIVIANLVGPYIQGQLIGLLNLTESEFIDKYQHMSQYQNGKMLVIVIMFAIYFGFIVISCVLSYISAIVLNKAGQTMIYNLREEVFTHIERLSIAQINATPVGKLVTRVTNDTNSLSELCTNVLVNLIRHILTIIFVIVMMLVLSPLLTLFMVVIGPILFVATFYFRKISRKTYRRVRSNITNVNAFLSENISGMKITQIFNQEEKKLEEFKEKNNALRKSSLREIFIFSIFRPAIFMLLILTRMIVLTVGVIGYFSFGLPISSLTSFYSYIDSFFEPIQNLADQFNQLQSAFASCEKIFEILDTKRHVLDKEDAIEIDRFKGEIEFRNVWFAYNDENWVLRDVSFKIEAKETVAFVGATGAGKTTILALLVRNYEIQKGEILIDGINIQDVKIESLRRNIGQMLQDVFLFSGTIRDNIRLRDENITDEDINRACELVNADIFINKLEKRLDYEVEERGANFSQGQRQLMSFARTIVHNPNIIVLDEATANIDTETELIIQDSLNKMMSVGTMLIVAHRLSTVQHADKIIVLHKGKIREMGNHQELLKKKGLYYSLYELQYKNMDTE